jgi:M6 family metalloprotease-like protein
MDDEPAAAATPLTNIGGRYITSEGIIRAFILFVRYADDTDSTDLWPDETVLPTWAQNLLNSTYSEEGNYTLNGFTDYIYKNSYGKLHIIGDVYYVTLPNNESYYYGYAADEYGCRAKVEADALTQLATIPNLDLSQYDNWKNLTTSTKFSPDNTPDNIVDLCFLMVRNQTEALMGEYEVSEARLYSSITINGITIQSGFPGWGSQGSGISFFMGNVIDQMPTQTLINQKISEYDNDGFHLTIIGCMAHELSHYLIGGNHFGVLEFVPSFSSYRSNSFMAPYACNSDANCGNFSGYEKIRLGWITSSEIKEIVSTETFNLQDMASDKSGFKIGKIALGDGQYIFLENRSWVNEYEPKYVHANYGKSLKPGVLAYLIPYEDDLLYLTDVQMVCADGKWDWTRLEGTGLEGVADRIDKLTPNLYSGYDEKEVIYMPTAYPSCDWLAIYDPNPADSRYGKWYKGDNYYDEYHNVGEYWGDVNDLFGVGDVITKWSNGASHKRASIYSSTMEATEIGIEILSKNSDSSYTITVRTAQPEQLSPSKPQAITAILDDRCRGNIQWVANTEPDISGYNI